MYKNEVNKLEYAFIDSLQQLTGPTTLIDTKI